MGGCNKKTSVKSDRIPPGNIGKRAEEHADDERLRQPMTVPAAGLYGIRERSTAGMHEPPARFPRQENQDTLQELLQVVKEHRGIDLLQQTEIVRRLYLRTAPYCVQTRFHAQQRRRKRAPAPCRGRFLTLLTHALVAVVVVEQHQSHPLAVHTQHRHHSRKKETTGFIESTRDKTPPRQRAVIVYFEICAEVQGR